MAELERMGAYGIPVTVIDGEEAVFGFDRKKLEELLGLWRLLMQNGLLGLCRLCTKT
ncbi:MAG TPA: hypothetical protein VFE09_00865 [Rubrobacteraceae bacterium]|nr:hypothetical protein [Rubrobacteraceae bacterium]